MSGFGGLPEVLRPAEVARVLRIHVGTLRRWDREGGLRPLARSEGGHRRYARADVLALRGGRRHRGREDGSGRCPRQCGEAGRGGEPGAAGERCGFGPEPRRRIVEAAAARDAVSSGGEYPDRLARFGFPYLATLFDVLGRARTIAAGCRRIGTMLGDERRPRSGGIGWRDLAALRAKDCTRWRKAARCARRPLGDTLGMLRRQRWGRALLRGGVPGEGAFHSAALGTTRSSRHKTANAGSRSPVPVISRSGLASSMRGHIPRGSSATVYGGWCSRMESPSEAKLNASGSC